MSLSFSVKAWDGWLGGVRSQEQWKNFLSHFHSVGSATSVTDALESVQLSESVDQFLYLKPRQRRRLSQLSKMTLDVAFGAAEGGAHMPTVFASRRGEVSRMAGLLESICRESEASPTAFSLSVHNTASGLFSIQSGNQQPSTAIAAGHDTVASALLEACGQLANGAPEVLLVISEEMMPEVYSSMAEQDEHTVAGAFLLAQGRDYQLSLKPQMNSSPEQHYASTAHQLVQLISAFVEQEPVSIEGERLQCQILPG